MDSRANTERTLKEAQGGDHEAFARLVNPLRERLGSLVFLGLGARLRQRVDVDDVLQDTFLRAYRSLGSYEWRDDGSFFRWLGTIAEHAIQDLARTHGAVRRGGLRHELPLEGDGARREGSPLDRLESPSPSPSRVLRREERLERLESALEKLSPEHREVIHLSHVLGLPTQEVARRMGRSRPAAAMLLLRALRELRAVFGSTESLHLPEPSLPAEGDSREPG